MDGTAKDEYKKSSMPDDYILENLLDYTKDKARSDLLAVKEKGAFESYRAILHKCFNISEERRLDVESRVLNPRRAKGEKDVVAAMQEWRQDQSWLIEAGCDHMFKLLREDTGRMAMTILI